MKKFFTIIPLQKAGQLKPYAYEAVGNQKLQMGMKTAFPILTALHGYVQQGEPFQLIALMADTEDGRRNCAQFQAELDALCRDSGLLPTQVRAVTISQDERVAAHVEVFQTLLDYVDDEDELFACITFGTKPLSQAMLLAMQYAYRVKNNVSISCIVYGQIDRSKSVDPAAWTAQVYDETALVQLDEIVHALAVRHVTNPKAVIDMILSL